MATSRKSASLVRLRSGGLDDLDDVMRIMSGAFQPCFGEAWTRSQCAGILPMSGVNLTIADDDRGPAGFSLARCVADEAELLLIAVDPACQRTGIGQVLLNDFIETVRLWGATRLHLEVRDGNPAVAMYRAAGFIPAGRRRNYYHGADGRAYDAVTLTLSCRND
jgi:ribosomal-protein-alanine N-acetyltransferase